jgi:membrane-bound lytic murein transglycosylase D
MLWLSKRSSRGVVAFSLVLAGAIPALAAYDRPVNWSDMSALDLRPVFRSQYASSSNLYEPVISDSTYDLVLRDADGRISKQFKVPPALRDVVHFWLRIYTEFTSQHVVVYDDRHPDVIFEVLDFRDIARTARNRVAYEITVENKIRRTIHAYRNAFRRLIRNPKPKNPTALEKVILAAYAKVGHKHKFRELARNLRAQTGQRDNIIKGLLAAETFFPKMERIFAEVGVPPEITRLSLVESSFNLQAISRVGASGVWQFMHQSALEYMTVDQSRGIDERISPLKATVGAAKLLKRNYSMLKSWPLAITSYHHGFRGLFKISKDPNHEEELDQWLALCSAKKSRIGWASKNYFAEYLAVLHAETYRHLFYGDAPLPSVRPIAFHSLERPQSALAFAKEKGIPLQEFKFYNPDVRNLRIRLPRGFVIALPGSDEDLAGLNVKKLRARARRT